MELKHTDILTDFASVFNKAVCDLIGEKHAEELCVQNFPKKNPIVALTGRIKIAEDAKPAETLKTFFTALLAELEKNFGMDFTEAKLNSLYRKFKERNESDEIVRELLFLIPEDFLEEERFKYLTKSELEETTLRKSKELKNLKEEIEEKIKSRTERLEQIIREKDEAEKTLVKREEELVEANTELVKIDKAKSEFVSMTAHQLRTPLSGIKWTLALIINGDFGELASEQKTFLIKTYESANRLISLVNDLLSVSPLQSGKSEYAFAAADMSEIMQSLIFEMQTLAEKKAIKITSENKAKDLPKIEVDAEKIRAVFQNLLENAIKYTNHGGTVSIDFGKKDNTLQIKIRDTGIGIPESQKRNIFKQFFRATNAIKMETDGTGLGLFIAKTIVERHGGVLSFESTEGAGTTFIINLPLAKKPE